MINIPKSVKNRITERRDPSLPSYDPPSHKEVVKQRLYPELPSYDEEHDSAPPSHEEATKQRRNLGPISHEEAMKRGLNPKLSSYEEDMEQRRDPSLPSYEEATRPDRIHSIIDNLEVLATNDDIIANLKQNRKHIEFRKKVQDIIETYDKQIDQNITPVDKKLKELEKWCEETTKTDNSSFWKNIVNTIKYYFTGDEVKQAFYAKAAAPTQNTKQAIDAIKESINNPSFSSTMPPQNNKGTQRER